MAHTPPEEEADFHPVDFSEREWDDSVGIHIGDGIHNFDFYCGAFSTGFGTRNAMGKLCDGWKVSGEIPAGYACGGDCPGYRSSRHRVDRAEQVRLIHSVVGWVCQQSDLVCGCFFNDFNRAEPDYSK